MHFTDVFGIDPETLDDYGAFNTSMINDLPLFIDPFLLFNSTNDDYQILHHKIIDYIRFLKDRADEGRINVGLLRSWFMFPEIKQNWLGFSRIGNGGSGLGMKFALALCKNLGTVFSHFGTEQITKGSHLEKLCLIEDGVGRDNISDFTTNLIKDYLLSYTQDFARQHLPPDRRRVAPVDRARFDYRTRTWVTDRYELPWYEGDYVLLTPKDILTKDDTWINREGLIYDFDDIAESVPDDQLRAQINDYFQRALPENPLKPDVDRARVRVIAEFPEFIDYYIRFKEEHGNEAVAVSEEHVKATEQLYITKVNELVAQLSRETPFYSTYGTTYDETRARVLFLKDVIENKGGHRLFFVNNEPIRRESDLQLLFRLTWFTSPSDVSREVNDGRGPVDFKVSRGSRDKSLVEFKLAKNTHLKRNLAKQVEIYEKASDAPHSLRVIVYFTDRELAAVTGILEDLELKGHPDVILIDAREDNKPSGSVA